jgi:hypothetical protein
MAIYSKTTKQMVVALINAGNPQLPFPINETDFDFSIPEVITDPGNGHNTRIRVMAKPNTNYTGNVLLTYRRLDIARIFKNVTPHVQNWIANTGANSTVLTTARNLLPLYGEKYGFNFNPAEWTDVNLTGYNGVRGDLWNLTPLATNLAFVGTVPCRWEIGERTLESLLPVDQLLGRRFPGGNDFSVEANHRYWVLPDGFDVDYTFAAAYLENMYVANGYVGGVRNNVYVGDNYNDGGQTVRRWIEDNLLRTLKARDGSSYTLVQPAGPQDVVNGINTKYDLTGLMARRYSLPHPDVPEANSEFYNRVVIYSTAESYAGSGFGASTQRAWATGKIYLHYNV